MAYSITGLPVEPFKPYFGLADEELAKHHIIRMIANTAIGFPCRILLADAPPGDSLLLVNHEYQRADNPYRGRHAIFVNEAARAPAHFIDEMPQVITVRRAISVRAFDRDDMIVQADVVPGPDVEALVLRYFADPAVNYIHAHNAARGCFAARIDRA